MAQFRREFGTCSLVDVAVPVAHRRIGGEVHGGLLGGDDLLAVLGHVAASRGVTRVELVASPLRRRLAGHGVRLRVDPVLVGEVDELPDAALVAAEAVGPGATGALLEGFTA